MAAAAREERLPDGSTVDELWEYLINQFADNVWTTFTAEEYVAFLNKLLMTVSEKFAWRGEPLAFQLESNAIRMSGSRYDAVTVSMLPKPLEGYDLVTASEFVGARNGRALRDFFLAACKVVAVSADYMPFQQLYLNCKERSPAQRLLMLFAYAAVDSFPHVNRREVLSLEISRTPLEAQFLGKVENLKGRLVVYHKNKARLADRLREKRMEAGLEPLELTDNNKRKADEVVDKVTGSDSGAGSHVLLQDNPIGKKARVKKEEDKEEDKEGTSSATLSG